MELRTMTQTKKTKGVIATAGLLGGLALASVPAFAQTTAPAAPPATQGGMMKGMPSGQGGMMMNPDMQKMSKMMDSCNHMMESTTQNKDGTRAPANPANKG